jgi:hypothetical protein
LRSAERPRGENILQSWRMSEVSPDELKRAVESQHGGTATFVLSVPIRERFRDQTVWEGEVHVFDLVGHPKASRAYAWSHAIDGSAKRRFFAALRIAPINTPSDAVRAAIVAEQRTK